MLEDENIGLKRIPTNPTLDKQILQDFAEKTVKATMRHELKSWMLGSVEMNVHW